MIDPYLKPYRYVWPPKDLSERACWKPDASGQCQVMQLPEQLGDLAANSRWPAFFPSSISLVTTAVGEAIALEKVVGASIVNRFPYVVALSFCRQTLSARHHPRTRFTEMLQQSGSVAIQYLPPGAGLDRAMSVIASTDDSRSTARLEATKLPIRRALSNASPVFTDAFMVYEAELVKPQRDFDGNPIYQTPWVDVGSHRVYFLEIKTVQLRHDIADGGCPIRWRSLPAWNCTAGLDAANEPHIHNHPLAGRYQKAYTPHYSFPSAGTIAFEPDDICDGMAVKHLPPILTDQVEFDNDRARWPCFFPSSLGLITSWTDDQQPNVMPCGSTTILSRHPLVVAPCVSYAAINERYAPRASLNFIRKRGRFGCSVPFVHDAVVNAITYTGNVSFALDPDKVGKAGLAIESRRWAPRLAAMPIHYECEVVGEMQLGTHIMFLGEVRRILVHNRVTTKNRLEWYAWAAIGGAWSNEHA